MDDVTNDFISVQFGIFHLFPSDWIKGWWFPSCSLELTLWCKLSIKGEIWEPDFNSLQKIKYCVKCWYENDCVFLLRLSMLMRIYVDHISENRIPFWRRFWSRGDPCRTESKEMEDKKKPKIQRAIQMVCNCSQTDEQRAVQRWWKAISTTEPCAHCAALIKAFSIHWLS